MKAVKKFRESKGWTQNQLAYHAGLATSVISQVENGKRDPSASTLRKLAEALDVAIPKLFEGEDPPKAQPRLPLLNRDGGRGLEDLSTEELGALITSAEEQALANLEEEYSKSGTGFRTSSDGWIDLLENFAELARSLDEDSRISLKSAEILSSLEFSILSTFITEEEGIRAFCRAGRVEDLEAAEQKFEAASKPLQELLDRKFQEQLAQLATEDEPELQDELEERRERKKHSAHERPVKNPTVGLLAE